MGGVSYRGTDSARGSSAALVPYDFADRLCDHGWQVPAYRIPTRRQDLVAQAVVRNGFTYDLADMPVRHIRRLDGSPPSRASNQPWMV